MGRKNRDYTDAEFEVIEPDQPKLRWWQGWRLSFDWRVFWVVAGTSALLLIARLTQARH